MDRKTEFVPVRMTPAEAAALRAVANERSCSVGAVMRWAVKTAMLGDPPGRQAAKAKGRARLDQSTGAPLQEVRP